MKNLLFILLFPLLSCQGQDCSKLPATFQSYDQAVELVRSSEFKIDETVNTSKSSWIRGAEYYSCDGITGFFILTTDKQDYIYRDMPVEIWEGFKNADSFGSYYNSHIKGKWLMEL